MAMILVNNARIGMRVSSDVYTRAGMKLLAMGTVLTKENIQMLNNHKVQMIDVNAAVRVQAISNEKVQLRAAIKKLTLFAGFGNEHIDQLLEGSRIERKQAQSIIFQQKDPGNAIYIIIEGAVKVYTHGPSGIEKILSIFKSGDSFGELSLLDGKPRSASAQALEETKLVSISRDIFMKVLQTNFDLAQIMMMEMALRISDTEQHLEDLALLDPRSRVIKSLLLLINRFGKRTNDRVEIQMSLDFNELAQMAGVKTEQYYEVISDLEKRRILTAHTNYIVIYLSKLRNS